MLACAISGPLQEDYPSFYYCNQITYRHIPPHFVWGIIALWCARNAVWRLQFIYDGRVRSVAHPFFKCLIPRAQMASPRRDLAKGVLWTEPHCVLPDLGCTSVHKLPPPRLDNRPRWLQSRNRPKTYVFLRKA